jgi:hypothetical protein
MTALSKPAPGEVDDAEFVAAALAEPFDPRELKVRPAATDRKQEAGNALAVVYIDARVVQERLDAVLGVTGWQDEYQPLPDGTVLCRLRCKIGGEWVTKADVGGQSKQPDGGNRVKAAFSDALKRAAVKFGVGRYIYRLGGQWLPWDGKKFTATPRLPQWALPKAAPKQLPAAEPSARPAASKPAPPDRAKVADVLCKAIGAAATAADLGALWKNLPMPAGFLKVNDAHTAAVRAAKDRRKAELAARPAVDTPATSAQKDEIETLIGELGWDSTQLALAEQAAGVTDPLTMTAAQAAALIDAMRGEVGVPA